MTSNVIQGYIRPFVYQNLSSTFVYRPISTIICINANIMKIQFFHKCPEISLVCYGEVFFTLRPSDLITTLTYDVV